MKKYNIYPYRNDLNIVNDDRYICKRLHFKNTSNKSKLKTDLIEIINYFFDEMNVNKNSHIFVVGIGNDNYTSDSIGPKTLKSIRVNYYLKDMVFDINKPKVSALEPGALGETGILTEKIIASVIKEIKPDIVILIDSYVTDNINHLNNTIEINNKGLYPGSGIKNLNSKLDKEFLGIPVIVIGVPTAIEIKFTNSNNYIPYLLSTKDVDIYVCDISKIIGIAINEAIDNLK